MSAPAAGSTLSGFLAARRSAAPALVCGDTVLSYAGLDGASRRVARGLLAAGVGPGDRVGLWLPNVPAWLVLYFACARLGAIAVAVNTRFRSAEVEDIVGRSGCKVLALWPDFKGIDFAAILQGADARALDALETIVAYSEDGTPAPEVLPGKTTIAYGDLEAQAPLDDDFAAPDAGCSMFTTSGTTSAPKLVLHRQSVMVSHGEAVARHFGYDAPQAKLLQAVPFCGVFGLSQAMATIAAARPMIVMPLFEAEAAVRLMREHAVTHTNGSDEMIDRMLAATEAERPFPHLRYFGYANFNAALDEIVERAEARGVTLCGLYGMSEVQALFARQPPDAETDQRRLCGGIPVSPEAEVRVRDPESGRIQPHGEAGEIELKGPSLMSGYYGDAKATRDAFTDDGFLKSGDLGYTSADGGFVFLSRMGDVLRLGGWLVSPGEIESFIRRHPAVDGCQVVGIARGGRSRTVAFVTLAPGGRFEESDVQAFCRRGLADFKVPERIFVLDAFPVTTGANGIKIQRTKLRHMAEELGRENSPGGLSA